jgi:hypothetical protein
MATRDHIIQIRVTAEELERFRAAAAMHQTDPCAHASLSAMIRRLAHAHADVCGLPPITGAK